MLTHLRSRLAPLAALWICLQAGVLVGVPVTLWAASGARAAECTCGHGPHALCPMHHSTDQAPHCAMQATNSGAAAIVTGLVALTGPTPNRGPVGTPVLDAAALSSVDTRLVGDRPIPPDPPPPRG